MAEMNTLKVPDMSCAHCEATIRNALGEALPGTTVEVDLESKLVKFSGDAAKGKTAIEDAGYEPEAV